MSHDTINTKTCTKCGNAYPATNEYFHQVKGYKDGLRSWCKTCTNEYAREYKLNNRDKRQEYYKINRDKIREQQRDYYQVNQDELRQYQQEYRQANPDKIRERDRKYNKANQDRLREKKRRYYQVNQDKLQDRSRKYYQTNKDKVIEYQREYRLVNQDKIRKYQKSSPEKYRIYTTRRNARKQSLPDTFTEQQWLACLEYFGYACVVCGASFESVTPHADHWIPLNNPDCPGTIATNMVCLCKSCNSSKRDKMSNIWLLERFEIDIVNMILKRVATYFELISNSDESGVV